MPIQADSVPAGSSEKFNARSEWRPIETAPLGKAVLVGGGHYYSDQGWDIPPGDPFTGVTIACRHRVTEDWRGDQLAHDEYLWHQPTHWMPLPSPPGAKLNISNEPERSAVSLNSEQSDAGKTEGETG